MRRCYQQQLGWTVQWHASLCSSSALVARGASLCSNSSRSSPRVIGVDMSVDLAITRTHMPPHAGRRRSLVYARRVNLARRPRRATAAGTQRLPAAGSLDAPSSFASWRATRRITRSRIASRSAPVGAGSSTNAKPASGEYAIGDKAVKNAIARLVKPPDTAGTPRAALLL